MVPKEFNLEGRVAMIATTGRKWLGALASYLAEAGADVALASQERKEVEGAAEKVKHLGRQVMVLPMDVTNYQQVEDMVSKVVSQWGKIDILVNNFNLKFGKPLLEVTEKEWEKVISANLTPVFICTKAVGKHMLERKQGKVIIFTSGLAERGLPNSAVYCASQGGIIQFTRALALEWARQNIQVNAIGTGWMADEPLGVAEDVMNRLIRYIPLKRLGRPDDVANLLIYLASDASSYVSGQTFYVDGGVMAHI